MYKKPKEHSNLAVIGGLTYIVVALALAVAVIYGWVLNILTILEATDAMSTGQFVVRVAGIFLAPLGGVMGYVGV